MVSYKNGVIPLSALALFENTGKRLQINASLSLTKLFDATEKATGARPYISIEQDLYRDLNKQIKLLGENYIVVSSGNYSFIWNNKKWRKVGKITCAKPGFSNHGLGIAADISFPTNACRIWFRKHCTEYDWFNSGDSFGEDWHKEYHGAITAFTDSKIIINNESENDMTIFINPTENSSLTKDGISRIWSGYRTINGIDYSDVWGVDGNGKAYRITKTHWQMLNDLANTDKEFKLRVIKCSGNDAEIIVFGQELK